LYRNYRPKIFESSGKHARKPFIPVSGNRVLMDRSIVDKKDVPSSVLRPDIHKHLLSVC
jgi:hypothetical protein